MESKFVTTTKITIVDHFSFFDRSHFLKKKLIGAAVVLIGVALAGWGGYNAYGEYQKKKLWEEGTRPFNTLTKIREAMNPVTGQPTDFNKKTMVILFNSECDHCQAEANILVSQMDLLKDIQLWFISFEEELQAQTFLEEKQLSAHPDFHLFITEPEQAKIGVKLDKGII